MTLPVNNMPANIRSHVYQSDSENTIAATGVENSDVKADQDVILQKAVDMGVLSDAEAQLVRESPCYSTSSPAAMVLFSIINLAIECGAQLSITKNEMNEKILNVGLESNQQAFLAAVMTVVFTVAGAVSAFGFSAMSAKWNAAKKADAEGNKADAEGNNGGPPVTNFDDSSYTVFGMNAMSQLGTEVGNTFAAYFRMLSADGNNVMEMMGKTMNNLGEPIGLAQVINFV